MRRLLPVALMSRHVSSSARITGRINEKVRTGHPAAELAFLQHALWGLDHYPDYLRRWQDKDVQNLENALEAVLAKVRAQRADAARVRRHGAKHRRPWTRCATAENWRVDDVVSPRVAKALGWAPGDGIADALRQRPKTNGFWGLLSEPEDDVYSLELFRPDFCAAIIAASDAAAEDDGHPRPRANLDVLGVGWLADLLLIVAERSRRRRGPRDARRRDWNASALDRRRLRTGCAVGRDSPCRTRR